MSNLVLVNCPYYIRTGRTENAFTIVCEGVCENSTERIVFETHKKRRNYIENHCERMGGCCPLASIKKAER